MSDNVIINKLEVERAELCEKISKIRDFLEGKNNKSISNQQHVLLNLQLNAMRTYCDILTFRIIDFKDDNKNEYINKTKIRERINEIEENDKIYKNYLKDGRENYTPEYIWGKKELERLLEVKDE